MQKRYWLLRGGVVFLITGIIFLLASELIINDVIWHFPANPTIEFLSVFYSIPFVFLNIVLGVPYFISHFIILAIYFFVGAILGWLYGKIKNRNKSI